MSTIIVGETGAPTTDPEAAWLIDAIDEHIVASETPRLRPGWFSASELGEPDDVLVARYRGVWAPEPHTARELRVFHNGTSRDADYKRYFADAGLSVVGEDEARDIVIPWLRLRGSLDDIAHHPETGEWWVVEFKTMNPYQYGRLQAATPEHVLQVTAYMAAASIPRAIVLYENKGDQALRGFYVPFDEGTWEEQKRRLVRLRKEAEAQDAAMRPGVREASLRLVRAMQEA